MSDWSGTLPDPATALEGLPASTINTMLDALEALTGPFSTWSPSYTNLTIGNGVVSARYLRAGKLLLGYWNLLVGSSTAVSQSPAFTLPYTPLNLLLSSGRIRDDSSGGTIHVTAGYLSVGDSIVIYDATTGQALDETVPWTWAEDDDMSLAFLMELA